MKRIKVHVAQESAARQAGLAKRAAQEEGFNCKCGEHHSYPRYVLAHWNNKLEFVCARCRRVYSLCAGKVKLTGRLPAKPARKPPAEYHADQPLWCCYQIDDPAAKLIKYRRITGYHIQLSNAEDEAFEHCGKQYPLDAEKAKAAWSRVLRRLEYPKLSQMIVNGLVVGCGKFIGLDAQQDQWTLKFVAPDGSAIEMHLNKEDFCNLSNAI